MCSLNDYRCDDEISVNDKNTLTKETTLCRKCRCENADVLLIGQSGYCKKCFLIAANHKFRANLGKSKLIRRDDSMLVDFSGELNSSVLLHLIKAGMSESAHKKLMFKTTILYIDDSGIVENTNEEKDTERQKVAKEVNNSGFDGYIVSLSQVLNKNDNLDIKRIDNREINNENDDQLRSILANLSDNTSRIDLLNYLRRRLLLLAARRLNCNKILVADSSTDIAAKVIGDVCLGRGAQLSTLSQFCDARYADIKILKPMRDFTQQELVHYAKYHKVNSVKIRKSDVTAPATSIQTLAHNFTMNLESQFSSTVSTVFRTAEKLSARNLERQDEEDYCVLCDGVLDSTSANDRVSAVRAIEVSRLVSTKCVNTQTFDNKKNGEINCAISRLSNVAQCNDDNECRCKDNKRGQITAENVWDCLCYSCKLIFRRSDILHTLPAPLLTAAQRKLSLKKMREEINDFLL